MKSKRAGAKNLFAINQLWSKPPFFNECLKIGLFKPLGDALIFWLVSESASI